ncbi:MAG: hypothetical protein NTX55_02525 [Candidatus Parcubacteria bacterium]|nr:hypothetical protein [Candidatus Parcubacteria bacterium]
MKKVFLAAALLFFCFCVFAYAAGTPSIFSYQGRLTNSSGDLLGDSGTTYYFAFSIWDAASSGTQLWPVGNPATTTATVRQGVFNVDINTDDYNFNTNQNIYLEVKVSSDNSVFQTLSPRQRISSSVFAQIAGAVSGIGQSSFGTTTPALNTVVTVEATTTSAVPLAIRGFLNQVEDLFRIVTSTGTQLLTFTAGGNLGIGTTTPSTKLNILNINDEAQLRLSKQNPSGLILNGEFYTDSSGDVRISSTAGNIRENDENLWVCSNACDVTGKPSGVGDTGNIILEKALIFDNNFRLAPTTTPNVAEVTMYASSTSAIEPVLIFDDLP